VPSNIRAIFLRVFQRPEGGRAWARGKGGEVTTLKVSHILDMVQGMAMCSGRRHQNQTGVLYAYLLVLDSSRL